MKTLRPQGIVWVLGHPSTPEGLVAWFPGALGASEPPGLGEEGAAAAGGRWGQSHQDPLGKPDLVLGLERPGARGPRLLSVSPEHPLHCPGVSAACLGSHCWSECLLNGVLAHLLSESVLVWASKGQSFDFGGMEPVSGPEVCTPPPP